MIASLARRAVQGGVLSLLVAAVAACASKPIEVNTSAIVTLDTTGQRAIRMRRPAPVKDFWSAMVNLDPDYPKSHAATPDQRRFAEGLRMVMMGEYDDAELLLDSLRRRTTDQSIRAASHVLLTAALQYQDKWKDLADLSAAEADSASLAERDQAGVELWAAAFRQVTPRRIEFPGTSVVVPLTLSVAGTPMIPIIINGKARIFWLDTGSSMSIVSSDAAAESNVDLLGSDTLEVVTATGRVPAQPAVIRTLELGGISIANATAMVVSSALMEIRVGDLLKPVKTVRIDGIIGFDIISRLDIQIDYARGIVRLNKPVKTAASDSQRNLFWVGTPIVRFIGTGGIPVHLGLDTGAQETYATQRMLEKIGVRTFVGERKQVGGFGGLKEFRGRFIERLRLSLRGKTLLFEKVLVFAPAVSTFADLDGVLGSDLGQTGIVRISVENGLFSVEESLFDPRLERRRE